MRKLVIWALDGGLGVGITGPADVFAVANAIWALRSQGAASPLFECRVESFGGAPVQTATGVTVQPHGAIDPQAHADAILLPGLLASASVTDVLDALKQYPLLLPALRDQHARGAVIAANCSATVLLAESGLLDGRAATTSWWLARSFRERYPLVDLKPEEVATEDGRVMCSGASTAALHMALRLVARFGTPGLALAVAKTLLIDSSGTTQTPYKSVTFQDQFDHADGVVLKAQRWMEKRLGQSIQLDDMLKVLNVSERTLIRRFKDAIGNTPIGYLQTLRIEYAKRLLETTTLTVEVVCDRVGYSDQSSFRRLFKREAGVSPREYQARFRSPARHKAEQ